MLPKRNRLIKNKEFEEVFKKGRLVREDFLSIKFVPNKKKYSRFGFVVSLKVSKKAVVRNKLKRWLRSLVRRNLIEVKKGFDVVVIMAAGSETKNFHQIQEKFDRVLKNAKLLLK